MTNNSQSTKGRSFSGQFPRMTFSTVKMAPMKVLVYWTEERQWSVVSESGVPAEVLPGQRTDAKYQGKMYPSIIIASKCFNLGIIPMCQNGATRHEFVKKKQALGHYLRGATLFQKHQRFNFRAHSPSKIYDIFSDRIWRKHQKILPNFFFPFT